MIFAKIAAAVGARTKRDRKKLNDALKSLTREGEIIQTGEVYRLKAPRIEKLLEGVVHVNARGFGFLTADGCADDFFIPPRNLGGALDGDRVSARKIPSAHGSDEVSVVEILERGIKTVCGTFDERGKRFFVRPDNKNYLSFITVPRAAAGGATRGDKVLVSITAYPRGGDPEGKVVEILGRSRELKTEERALIVSSEIQEDFKKPTLDEALEIPQKVPDSAIIGRIDFRNKLIFTIDGDTARDFDDAVSLEINERGNYVLGVHIADVSEYVAPGSSLDEEAFSRGTSVYLPDKVIPMLPFELSNGICSLNEGADRLTLSVVAEITPHGETVRREFYKSVIRSKHRMTYANVLKIINGDEQMREKYSDIAQTIDEMNALKTVFENRRRAQGGIDLTVKDADVFEENGEITVSEHESNDATRLIEQFMIYANEAVGEYLRDSGAPAVYRIHAKPSAEKLETLSAFLNWLGIALSPERADSFAIQKLIASVGGTSVSGIVNQMTLRSMQKAAYSEKNIGHFGLASDCYLHFTSPIRRYPDLVVHRILKGLLDGKKSELTALYGDFVAVAAKKSSERERLAETLERDVDDLYKAFYMRRFIGEEVCGTVSGVTKFGVFVELDNTVEGIIKIEDLPPGSYRYDERRMKLESRRLSFSLGERVSVGVLGVNLSTRRAEFAFIKKISRNRA